MKYRFEDSVPDGLPATSPHFDDERTVQTAQPVVPLEEIEAKVRHRRQWFLGGAFAIAMMLGAASALLASYFKVRNTPAPAIEVSQQQQQQQEEEIPPAPAAMAESTPADTPVETEIAEAETEEPKPEPKRRVVVRHAEPEPRDDSPRMNEDEQLQRIRESVLVDEWQERRARRVWRRERRLRERYNHRDLSNLDEIFEGRRRPNNN